VRENPRWGYVRIQGELLKPGIGVSATTIATVLRSSGLGPAPRRIGPTWSEFLRAQAHSMLGGSPSSVADDDLGDDASDPSGSPQAGPDSQVEAGDRLSPADAVEPPSASHPVWSRSAPRGRTVSPRPEGRSGCRRRTDPMPRDGPQRPGPPSSHSQVLRRDIKPIPSRPTFAANRASNPLGRLRGSSAPRRPRNSSATGPSCTPEPSFFTPQRYTEIHLVFADSRRFAEEWTYRFLTTALTDSSNPSPNG
jgi:hypothetical protein